jgi:hypothetical protein
MIAGWADMTKARTKAARRRRANIISLPGGGTVASRAIGRERHHTQQPEPPADLVALTARAKFTGCTVEEARDILASEDMGRCIRAVYRTTQTRRDLLDVWMALLAAHWNFYGRCLSMKPSAQSSALPMLPEPMQTDPSLRVDIRTGDERDEAARRVWYAWLERFSKLSKDHRQNLRGHLQGYGDQIWNADTKQPTSAGVMAVGALYALHIASRG